MTQLDLAALERALANVGPHAARGNANAEQRLALRGPRERDLPKLVARAVAAVDSERNVEGAQLALRAVERHPECALAYVACAVALDRLGFLGEALAFYEEALRRAPNDVRICALLGATALRAREPELAEQFYRLAMRMEPDSLSHVNNLAGVLRDLGRFTDAIELLRNRLYAAPEAASLWNTLGTVVQEQGDPETAQTFLAEAARLDPRMAAAHHNRAIALADLGRFEDACDELDRAMDLVSSSAERAEIRGSRAYARLGAGRLAEGWADYEARFDPLTREHTLIRARRPRWDLAAPLAGKHLLIMGEQGLGDEILFMSAARDAISQAGAVTIACQDRLRPLLARSFPSARIVRHLTSQENGRMNRLVAPQDWEGVDLWTPMGDLAKAYRARLDQFPAAAAFLAADPARVASFKAQLGQDGRVKIGIVWKSLVMSAKRARFFAPFAAWAPLLRVAGADFYSLQYGDIAAEEALAAEKWGVRIHRFAGLDLYDDLDGVAAAGCALDLIIGPANASANLAAACGAETWLVARRQEWTMLGADHMPWYPRARVFLGEREHEWRAPFDAMTAQLVARTAKAAA